MNDPRASSPAGFAPVAAPGAPAAGGDPTRRWAIRFPDGRDRLAGITRVESERLLPLVSEEPPDRWDDLLAEVVLPVVLSDGAGPHLIDAAGGLVLVLAAHAALPGASLAMGQPAPDHRVGAVVPIAPGRLWRWRVVVSVDPARRVACLDELDAVPDDLALSAWAGRWGEATVSGPGP